MTLRVLTIQEMLAQKDGVQVVLAIDVEVDGGILACGDTIFRASRGWGDDCQSVAYEHQYGWDFFEEGEVAVVEVTKHPLIIKPSKEQTARPEEELGVYRPDLDTRKVGKIRVELVDDGFPLALREVAKVMTWAQTAKGYKDHDWQNLPNAEIALAAAASRHRTDHIEQRVVQGLDIDQCVDVESSLHHKAHEAFGVLAQLELMLRGKFVDKHTAHAV